MCNPQRRLYNSCFLLERLLELRAESSVETFTFTFLAMSKGNDNHTKTGKTAPTRTLKEKRADKKNKRKVKDNPISPTQP